MKRIKLSGPVLKSRAEAEGLAREICERINEHRLLNASMDQEITAVRERYEQGIAAAAKAIDEKTTVLQAWADANPSEFAGRKSLEMTHAVIGYRTGQPQAKTMSGWTWDRVLERIKSLPPFAGFLRQKEEVDKQGLIAARESMLPEDYRTIGVRIVQDETFFVEPKLAEQIDRVVNDQAAA